MTVVHIHVLYCDSGTYTCFVLCQLYVHMFCIVTMVRVQALLCHSGAVVFFIVTVVHIHVLYCDSGMCIYFVLL